MENHYLSLCSRILTEGKWTHNQRTGTQCLTVINADLEYTPSWFPLVTTRKCYWKPAIAELLGYIRGYQSAEDFRKLGTKTWDANANNNHAWLNNPNRKGHDDCGLIYGAIGRAFPKIGGGNIDLLESIVNHLKKGIDDRGEILTFYHPGAFHLGCLRPCMYSHHFSLLEDTLYLTSYQRSCDVPLGLTFNMIQVYTLLVIMAQITGKKAGVAYHKIVNAHIYQNQVPLVSEQIQRIPYPPAKLNINPDIKTLKDLETWVTLDDFMVTDYQHHPAIKYPFTV